jgi:UDP-N-acetylmuramoyl-tripeptide--D-alanyl-D-alanine ligase
VVDEDYVEVIDDSYNASPESVSGAIDVLSSRDGKKVLVLGDMAELGEDSTALHAEIGSKASDNIDKIYAIGEHAEDYLSTFSGIGEKFADMKSLCDRISQDIVEHKYNSDNGKEKITLLIKGSRSMHMERVIEHLLKKNVGGGM